MDAMLDEKLDLEGFWAAYVGSLTPLEFMNRQYSPDIRECVAEYVSLLPQLFGIVRRQTWKEAFGAPTQFRKDAVLAALVDKLELTEAEWRPHLNQRPRPEPVPEPVAVQNEFGPAPDHADANEWKPEAGDWTEAAQDARSDGEGMATSDEVVVESSIADAAESGGLAEGVTSAGEVSEEAKDGDA